MNIRRSRNALIGGALLLAGLLAGPLMPRAASAHIVICRDDPIVSLLNLGQLDMQSAIGDSASDVKMITYAVHVPIGTHVLAITNLDGLFGLRSTVKVYADNAPNTFDVYTTISTGQSGVRVTSTTILVSLLNLNLGIGAASGTSGQTVHVHFRPLL